MMARVAMAHNQRSPSNGHFRDEFRIADIRRPDETGVVRGIDWRWGSGDGLKILN
jgi:hypothetical protein